MSVGCLHSWRVNMLLAVLTLACCCGVSRAIINDVTIHLSKNSPFVIYEWFGFQTNGSIDISLALDTTYGDADKGGYIYAFVCSDSNMSMVLDTFDSVGAICTSIDEGAQFTFGPVSKLSVTSPTALYRADNTANDFYFLVMVNCDSKRYSVSASYSLVNPNGEQLSVGYIEYKALSLYLSIAWAAPLVCWILAAAVALRKPSKLQWALTALQIANLAYCVVEGAYWRQYSKDGTDPSTLKGVAFLIVGLKEGLLFAILLLISKGWGITRPKLSLGSSRMMAAFIVVFVLLIWLFRSFPGLMSFFFILIYALVLRVIFSDVKKTARLLTESVPLRPQSAQRNIRMKLLFFKRYQVMVAVYIACDALSGISVGTMAVRAPWIHELADQLLTLLFVLFLMIFFVVRKQSPYIYETLPEVGLPRTIGSEASELQWSREWRNLSRPRKTQQFVIIHNPPTVRSDGSTVENVAIGIEILPSQSPATQTTHTSQVKEHVTISMPAV